MAAVARLDHALGRVLDPLAGLLPRRARRIAERIERGQTRFTGQGAAVCFLLVTIAYGAIAGGQVGRLGDAALVFLGFGIHNIRIAGDGETGQQAVLEKLQVRGSLLAYDIAAAQDRIGSLPWVETATVRKYYPDTLSVRIVERQPFALWQSDGTVVIIDREGNRIVALDDPRFADLPLLVGAGADRLAADFVAAVEAQPVIADRLRAAIRVAGRRWDLFLEGGVTVKLPERGMQAALAQLAKLDAEKQILARDVVVVDLRLPDRVTVRLPEGRSLDDVTSEGQHGAAGKART